jgi:hypothetical protein
VQAEVSRSSLGGGLNSRQAHFRSAVCLNAKGLKDAEADGFVGKVTDETELPDEPFRGFADSLLEAMLETPKTKVVGF